MCRGYLWQNETFTDLNSLLPPGTNLFIALPFAINERGDITGMAIDLDTGEPHVFLATPVHGAGNGHVAGERHGHVKAPAMPGKFRELFRRSRRRKAS